MSVFYFIFAFRVALVSISYNLNFDQLYLEKCPNKKGKTTDSQYMCEISQLLISYLDINDFGL